MGTAHSLRHLVIEQRALKSGRNFVTGRQCSSRNCVHSKEPVPCWVLFRKVQSRQFALPLNLQALQAFLMVRSLGKLSALRGKLASLKIWHKKGSFAAPGVGLGARDIAGR